MTYVLMVVLVLFLAFVLSYKAKYTTDTRHLFDKKNSNALRGFWCLIIVLVHIPALYQNRIQDMLGSFAYIGVTFFFMVSAYGMKFGLDRNPDSIKHFWRRRLPRLLIPMLFVNVISILFRFVECEDISIMMVMNINGWVRWFLVCYLVFWSVKRFTSIGGGYQDAIICVLITIFSLMVYFMKKYISAETWCPEILGFVWGIVFSNVKDKFTAWTGKKWVLKTCTLCTMAGVTGVAYLKFKPVVFFGDYLLKILLGVLIITFMLVLNSHVMIGNKVSLFLGGISYEVYLMHGSVFALISYAFLEIDSGCFIVGSMLLTLLISYVVNLCSRLVLERLNSAMGNNVLTGINKR